MGAGVPPWSPSLLPDVLFCCAMDGSTKVLIGYWLLDLGLVSLWDCKKKICSPEIALSVATFVQLRVGLRPPLRKAEPLGYEIRTKCDVLW